MLSYSVVIPFAAPALLDDLNTQQLVLRVALRLSGDLARPGARLPTFARNNANQILSMLWYVQLLISSPSILTYVPCILPNSMSALKARINHYPLDGEAEPQADDKPRRWMSTNDASLAFANDAQQASDTDTWFPAGDDAFNLPLFFDEFCAPVDIGQGGDLANGWNGETWDVLAALFDHGEFGLEPQAGARGAL